MKLQRVLVALMTMMLLIPAATAYGTDQSVEVSVLPTGVLSVNVQEVQFGFGVMVPGQTRVGSFNMGVTNTTDPATGWVITVDTSGDFESGNCEYYTDSGCVNWTSDGIGTIPISNLSIVGGDLNWFDQNGDAITSGSGTFGSGAITLNTGTADAWGDFPLHDPNAEMTLVLPGETVAANYRTILTYTIAAP